MRKQKIWFGVILAVLTILCSCSMEQSGETAPATEAGELLTIPLSTRPSQTAFKGMGLYTWQNEDGDWLFSVLPGTNRIKSVEEVQANAVDMEGVRQSLCEIAVGETVVWRSDAVVDSSGDYVAFPLPPADLLSELKEQADQCEVELVIPNR